VLAVNAEGSYGRWQYRLIKDVSEIGAMLTAATAVSSSSKSLT
jgi:hypothetical protein